MRCLLPLLIAVTAVAGCFSKPDRYEGVDAGVDLCQPGPCEGAGGRCMNGTCTIEGRPNADVNCPNGMPCQVTCTGRNACRAVRCHDATSCTVDCLGEDTCSGVSCDSSETCDVQCEGRRSCPGVDPFESVYCVDSQCTVMCSGEGSCARDIAVNPGGMCTVSCCGPDSCRGSETSCSIDNSCP